MHATLPQMLRGWGRIYSGTSRRRPWRILAVALFLLVCGFSAYAALGYNGINEDYTDDFNGTSASAPQI